MPKLSQKSPKKKPSTPSNVIPFPISDEAVLRDVIGPSGQILAMPGGWEIYRWDGTLYGYLIRVTEAA